MQETHTQRLTVSTKVKTTNLEGNLIRIIRVPVPVPVPVPVTVPVPVPVTVTVPVPVTVPVTRLLVAC